jgi:hypothetical protein
MESFTIIDSIPKVDLRGYNRFRNVRMCWKTIGKSANQECSDDVSEITDESHCLPVDPIYSSFFS